MSTVNKHRIPCPHCGQNLRIRNSQGLTPIYRVAIVECRNDMCGFRGKVGIEVTNTIAQRYPKPDGGSAVSASHEASAGSQTGVVS